MLYKALMNLYPETENPAYSVARDYFILEDSEVVVLKQMVRVREDSEKL